jgi:sugar phosphate isomerase/epimerase
MIRREQISTVTDEVDFSPAVAVRRAADWGIHHIELRLAANDARVPEWPADVVDDLQIALRETGSRVISLSPGFGKPGREPTPARLSEVVRLARLLSVDTITSFTPAVESDAVAMLCEIKSQLNPLGRAAREQQFHRRQHD